MTLMPQVLHGGELDVQRRVLEHDPHPAPRSAACSTTSTPARRAPSRRSAQRRQDLRSVVFPPPFGPSSPNSSPGGHRTRPLSGLAFAVPVSEVLDLDGPGSGFHHQDAVDDQEGEKERQVRDRGEEHAPGFRPAPVERHQ